MDTRDPKDLVDQLRTIHFTLLVVCLGAVVVVLSPGPLSVSKAVEELNQTIAIQKNWQTDWIKQTALKVAMSHGECSNRPMPDGTSVHLGSEHFRAVINRKWDVQFPSTPGLTQKSKIADLPTLRAPDTLADFKQIWDSSGSLICPADDLNPRWHDLVRSWDSKTNTYVNGNRSWEIAIEQGATSATSTKTFDWIRDFPEENGDDLGLTTALLETTPEQYRWVLPIENPRISVRPFFVRTEIIANNPQYVLRNVDFGAAFPELSRATSGITDLSLDHLQKLFQNQESAAKENFEAFGLKFPAEATKRWAVFLIIVIQLYFWVHFREYIRIGQPECGTAWIGIYKQWPARALSLITLIVVPVAVTAFLSYQKDGIKTNHWLQAVAIALSVAIAFPTAYLFWRSCTSVIGTEVGSSNK
jgi:hypothetical protein